MQIAEVEKIEEPLSQDFIDNRKRYSKSQVCGERQILKQVSQKLLNENGKVNFNLLKYDSNELFERLPVFEEAPLNFFYEDCQEPWTKLAKAIVSPYSNFRFHLEIAKNNMSQRDKMPFYFPKSGTNKAKGDSKQDGLSLYLDYNSKKSQKSGGQNSQPATRRNNQSQLNNQKYSFSSYLQMQNKLSPTSINNKNDKNYKKSHVQQQKQSYPQNIHSIQEIKNELINQKDVQRKIQGKNKISKQEHQIEEFSDRFESQILAIEVDDKFLRNANKNKIDSSYSRSRLNSQGQKRMDLQNYLDGNRITILQTNGIICRDCKIIQAVIYLHRQKLIQIFQPLNIPQDSQTYNRRVRELGVGAQLPF
eukprot:403363286